MNKIRRIGWLQVGSDLIQINMCQFLLIYVERIIFFWKSHLWHHSMQDLITEFNIPVFDATLKISAKITGDAWKENPDRDEHDKPQFEYFDGELAVFSFLQLLVVLGSSQFLNLLIKLFYSAKCSSRVLSSIFLPIAHNL